MSDEQDVAEAFDEDKLDDGVDDPVGAQSFPPEAPLGVEELTDPGADEPLAQRVEREEPEVGAGPDAVEPPGADQPVGRLLASDSLDGDVADQFVDDEPDAVASAWSEVDLSAEEAAVHLTADPPMGSPGDGYIDA